MVLMLALTSTTLGATKWDLSLWASGFRPFIPTHWARLRDYSLTQQVSHKPAVSDVHIHSLLSINYDPCYGLSGYPFLTIDIPVSVEIPVARTGRLSATLNPLFAVSQATDSSSRLYVAALATAGVGFSINAYTAEPLVPTRLQSYSGLGLRSRAALSAGLRDLGSGGFTASVDVPYSVETAGPVAEFGPRADLVFGYTDHPFLGAASEAAIFAAAAARINFVDVSAGLHGVLAHRDRVVDPFTWPDERVGRGFRYSIDAGVEWTGDQNSLGGMWTEWRNTAAARLGARAACGLGSGFWLDPVLDISTDLRDRSGTVLFDLELSIEHVARAAGGYVVTQVSVDPPPVTQHLSYYGFPHFKSTSLSLRIGFAQQSN
ncbi:MAG: hypothetical protein R6X13_09210 [bacterium]